MSANSMQMLGSYTASSNGDRLFPVTVQIQNEFGGFTPVTALSDTGNEQSIFRREVADQLGLDLSQGESFKVAGINGQGREFKKFKRLVKIGTLQPIMVTIGFAVDADGLVENLLGNSDILNSGKFEVTYDQNGVTYRQKALTARVSDCSTYGDEQETLNHLYDQLSSRRKRFQGCGCDHSHDKRDGGEHNSIAAYGMFY